MAEKRTYESVLALIEANAKEARERSAAFAEERAVYAKERAAYAEEARERSAKIDAQIAEYVAAHKETEAQFQRIHAELGGMGKSDGMYAEECFANSLSETLEFAGQKYDYIDRNLRRKNKNKVKGEFDIVMYNGEYVALIEVKYRATTRDLDEMVDKKVPVFRTLFPHYAGYTLNLGIASLSFDNYVIEKARKLGIGTLTQKGDAIEVDTSCVRAY